ncbi:HD family phosphohydrolase [Caviibacter abscessus]|uniref:HD family phosphohydrolase n=1 Tax=Caviibacter abscessus TaxID=1766719 RepID=UPI00082CA439|nr:HDIG domain-containing metalloprotein [Caviibacter abscessus]
MKINFFGRKIEISIKNVNVNLKLAKDNSTMDKYSYRTMFLLLTFLFFVILSLIHRNSTEYIVGNKVEQDIIAYKTVVYEKDILNIDIQEKIEKNTSPEFDRKIEVGTEKVKKFSELLQELSKLDLKNENSITKFIEKNKLNISESDIKKIGINGDLNYYIYLTEILTGLYEEGIVRKTDFNKILSKKQIVLESYEKNLLRNYIEPNLIINEEKTREKIKENINALKNNKIKISKGDIIAKKGDIITQSTYDQLEQLGLVNNHNKILRISFTFLFLSVLSILYYIGGETYLKKGINSKGFYPTFITFIIINVLYWILDFDELMLFIIPFASLPIVASILTKEKMFSLSISILASLTIVPNLEWFIILIVISIIAIITNEKLTNRLELVKNGFKIGVMQAIFSVLYGVIYNYGISYITIFVVFSLISGFFTGMICLGILPYFENTFSILTDIKLLELGDYSSSLLKQLLLTAPGTFHHSIMVGALAEQAAEVIGANPILARVGAYYHDIGKMKRPLYFVENQGGLENLHNELKPSLSALILTSHPKDGYILGKQHGLPEEILNIIVEHHGTTMVQYFYYKAVEIGENVSEVDFRYVGPKPSTKESAIVMLADTVEAAVRASKDKSREGIENTIRYLVKYKIDDNQLSNCDINLADIEKIIEAFLVVLKAIYHERIQYPKINSKK